MCTLQLNAVAKIPKLLITFILVGGVIGPTLSDDVEQRSRSFPQAAIFDSEDKVGKSVDYFHHSQEFADVEELVNIHGMEKVALLCAKGVFVLYNHALYMSQADDDAVIFAGIDPPQCTNPGSMRSLLFIEGYINPMTPTLTIFEDERFTTPHYIINRQDEHDHQGVQSFGIVKSFVLMGATAWTVTTTKGTYCLKAGIESEFPVCPVAYSSKVFGEPVGWISAERECEGGFDTEVKLEYCFNHGSGNLEPITDGSPPPPEPGTFPPTPGNDTSGSSSGLFSNCDQHDEFAMLLRIRLTHDFEHFYQVQFPFNKKHAWRTEILDNTFEIVSLSQPDNLVSRDLLLIIRELYIYFAEKMAWNVGNGWPTAMPTQRVKLMGYETTRCLEKLTSLGWLQRTSETSLDFLRTMEKPEFSEDAIEPAFRYQPRNDIIMEFVWLAINYVGVTCHGALEFQNDFWMEYMNLAYNMYLHPMLGFWAHNEIVSQYYPIILGGFNITSQLEGLAVATTILYKGTPINRLNRPSVLANIKAEGR
ncbi:hypothetical protein Ocin01_01640 [Orchesella cincta]|uniref:Uncharacterized protein n=1 Tax=Orchesella cincta TaxID=48709 RepID=A0A1D2NIF0_ORCCI|nr:hypothetical protein Ocin01_01640 [Orchesella cincta]